MNKKKLHLFNLHHTGSAGVLMFRVALMAIMFLIVFPYMGSAQVGIGTKDINASAILQVETSTNDKGILLPRLTKEQRDAINTNAAAAGETVPAGLTIYCTDCFGTNSGSIYYYNGVEWRPIDNNALDTAPPSAPTSLTASNPTDSSIDLSWTASTDNVGVTGYYIYFSNNTLAATVTSGTSTTIAGLSHGTLYTFYATAFDAAGNESSSSNNASETTTTPPPVIINEGYFETGNDDWVDYGRSERNNSSEYSCEQDWSMRIRDDRTGSRIELLNKDLTTYNLVTINFEYKTTNNWEPDDRFELKLNNIVIGTWYKSESCTSVSISIDSSDYTFGSQDDFKFEGEMDSNSERVYIDAVVIKGYIAP